MCDKNRKVGNINTVNWECMLVNDEAKFLYFLLHTLQTLSSSNCCKLGSCSAAVAACIFSLGFPFLASSRGGRLQLVRVRQERSGRLQLALRVLRHPEEVRQLPAVRRQGTWQRPRGPRLPGGERSRSFVIPGTPAASSTPEKLMYYIYLFYIPWNFFIMHNLRIK